MAQAARFEAVQFEVVVEGAAGAVTAERAGAHRVEVVAAAAEGGVTPSMGTLAAVMRATSRVGVHPIVRPRTGDFVYDDHEAAAMEYDVGAFARAGADGIATGALTADGSVDTGVVKRLVDAAAGLPVTFHRAFDFAPDPFAALEDLVALGVRRVLTSGGQAAAGRGAPLIAQLVEAAAGRITVLPGGGVTAADTPALIAAGARELHFSGSEQVASPVRATNARIGLTGRIPTQTLRTINSAERMVPIMRAAREAATAEVPAPAGQPGAAGPDPAAPPRQPGPQDARAVQESAAEVRSDRGADAAPSAPAAPAEQAAGD
ncbi:copper homeostasis protein CutC [Nocardiopsis coralliicola]